MKTTEHDVAILGGGLMGSLLAAILARHGLRVLIVEADVHPRFAIGESLVPETSLRFTRIAKRFDVPEIGWLGSAYEVHEHIGPTSGLKRAFSFLWSEEGQLPRPEDAYSLPTLTPPFGPDCHLFRQDTDAAYLAVAVRYGVEVRQATRVEGITFEDDGVTLALSRGGKTRAKMVVDGAGYRSPVATTLGLRDAEPRCRVDSRSLFTHMLGVKPYEQIQPGHGLPHATWQTTLHHLFDGGWMWVIPFGNHPAATNPLCSVGLMLDRRKYPDPDQNPEEEFRRFCSKYPSLQAQFRDAVALRPWVSTGRIQYTSRQIAGDRWFLLPHAAGFLDPLFSNGISQSAAVLDLLAPRILEAVREDDFDPARFEPAVRLTEQTLAHYDTIVAGAYDGWRHPDLANAWLRVWALGNFMGTFSSLHDVVEGIEREPEGLLSSQIPSYTRLVEEATAITARANAGELPDGEAAREIIARLPLVAPLAPFQGWGDRSRNHSSTYDLPTGGRLVWWHRLYGGAFGERFTFRLHRYALMGLRWNLHSALRQLGRIWRPLRDIVFTRNGD